MANIENYRAEYTVEKIAEALHAVDPRFTAAQHAEELRVIMEDDDVDLGWATVAALVENKA